MIIHWILTSFSFLPFFTKPGYSEVQNLYNFCEISSLTSAKGNAIEGDLIFCPGDLIFEENFESLDLNKWKHEIRLANGKYGFQWYTNNRSNSFVKNGALYIRPTLTSDFKNKNFLTSGLVNLYEGNLDNRCTSSVNSECKMKGTTWNIINPVRSARLGTSDSFSFKYGKIQVRAKMPCGDWLWPSIALLPKDQVYGPYPKSGEIYMAISRGNKHLEQNGVNIGTESIMSTLLFGPSPEINPAIRNFAFSSPPDEGFDKKFHTYEMEWTPDSITFKFDVTIIGHVEVGRGFWIKSHFARKGYVNNPWKHASLAAPFDQEFFIGIGVAVGGLLYFPDTAENAGGKPWANTSPTPMVEFWNGRKQWLSTWNFNKNGSCDSSLIVDYVRVYAL